MMVMIDDIDDDNHNMYSVKLGYFHHYHQHNNSIPQGVSRFFKYLHCTLTDSSYATVTYNDDYD